MTTRLRSHIISFADRLVLDSGFGPAVDRHYGGLGICLMFHSVVDSPRKELYQDIKFSSAGLEALLQTCKTKSIDLLNIDGAMQRLNERSPGKFVVFTFDDGYKDNLTNALPIFERHNAPFTVFVTTDLIKRQLYYWWGGLLELIKQKDQIDIEALGVRLELNSEKQKQNALYRISRWVERDVSERSPLLVSTFSRYGINLADLMEQDGLTVSDLRQLAKCRLVTIGGHTKTHRPLASLAEQDALNELLDNRNFLEQEIQKEVQHFAFPHGDSKACGPRDAALVRGAGFRTGFSTRKGNLFPQHASAPYLLPRGSMNPRRESSYHLHAQIFGVHRWLHTLGGNAIDADTLRVGRNNENWSIGFLMMACLVWLIGCDVNSGWT